MACLTIENKSYSSLFAITQIWSELKLITKLIWHKGPHVDRGGGRGKSIHDKPFIKFCEDWDGQNQSVTQQKIIKLYPLFYNSETKKWHMAYISISQLYFHALIFQTVSKTMYFQIQVSIDLIITVITEEVDGRLKFIKMLRSATEGGEGSKCDSQSYYLKCI